MNIKRDCTTCEYRQIVDWIKKIAHCDKGIDGTDGYPFIGDECEQYSRIPGSDDDYEGLKKIEKGVDYFRYWYILKSSDRETQQRIKR